MVWSGEIRRVGWRLPVELVNAIKIAALKNFRTYEEELIETLSTLYSRELAEVRGQADDALPR